jgi:hypothetical protein
MECFHHRGKFLRVDKSDGLFPAAFNNDRLQVASNRVEQFGKVSSQIGIGRYFGHGVQGSCTRNE